MPSDLLHPSAATEKGKHKLKRLIQGPNSFFMDVKCPGCFHITTVFSHAQVSLLYFIIYVCIKLYLSFCINCLSCYIDCCIVPWLCFRIVSTNRW